MWLTIAIITVFATVTMAKASAISSKMKSTSSAGSPRRKKRTGKPGSQIDKKETMKKPNSCSLKICKFHETLSFEMIIYERTDGEDGYLHFVRQFAQGERENDVLEKLGINRLVPRRMPDTNNEIMLGVKKGYWRQIIVRYVDEPSTTETRKEALDQLKTFFLDPNFTKYPPPMIETIDLTDSDKSLDDYFLDDDIQTLMKEDIEEEDLNGNFTRNFAEFAQICWKYDHVSQWARSLGFPMPKIEPVEPSKFSLSTKQDDQETDGNGKKGAPGKTGASKK